MPVEWRVPVDHPAFAGHFPGRSILPAVVLLERSLRLAGAPAPGHHWVIAQAKFLHPVAPGALLRWSLTSSPHGGTRFAVHQGAQLVASGVLQQEAGA